MQPAPAAVAPMPADHADTAVYRWRLFSASPQRLSLAANVAGIAALPVAAFYVLRVLRDAYAPVAGAVSMLLLLGFVVGFVAAFRGEEHRGAGLPAQVLLGAAVGNLLYLFSGAAAGTLTYTEEEWYLFYLDQLLSVALLDIPELFGVTFSSIAAPTPGARLLVLVMRLGIAASIVAAALSVWRIHRSGHVFYGTVGDCASECQMIGSDGDYYVQCTGRIEHREHAPVRVADFLARLSEAPAPAEPEATAEPQPAPVQPG